MARITIRARSIKGRFEFFQCAWRSLYGHELHLKFKNSEIAVDPSFSGWLFCAIWHLIFGEVQIEGRYLSKIEGNRVF